MAAETQIREAIQQKLAEEIGDRDPTIYEAFISSVNVAHFIAERTNVLLGVPRSIVVAFYLNAYMTRAARLAELTPRALLDVVPDAAVESVTMLFKHGEEAEGTETGTPTEED